MGIELYKNDIPKDLVFSGSVAIDTETLGLQPHRDRLCLVQLSSGDGNAHLVQLVDKDYSAPNLRHLLNDDSIIKIFHFARFDVAVLKRYLGVSCNSVYCTKIASKLARTYTEKHGLKELCRELLNVELSKQQQSSDWAEQNLSDAQKSYAASDVLYLHKLKEKLDTMLRREGRYDLAIECFKFLSTRADLDLLGWPDLDIFAH